MTEDELLSAVRSEFRRSVGLGSTNSDELTASREKALNYYKGKTPDIKDQPNRSTAVDTAVAEAVDTVLPDLVEIFIGGDDIATFTPQGPNDETAAQEESDFVKHVVTAQNPGFLLFNTAFKDALLTRTGVFHWYWETKEVTEPVAQVAQEWGEQIAAVARQISGQEVEIEEGEGVSTITRKRTKARVVVCAVPSEDFTVAEDTVELKDATYCAMRARPRVQDLIARGIDAAKARALKPYSNPDETVSEARDEAGEGEARYAGDGETDLRQVEVLCHYIRLLEGDELKIWKVETDGENTVILSKDEVTAIHFGALTPYMNPHRFYGESVADKLFEIQRIKTTLLRMFLDSGYFALNQRMEVAMSRANEFTISDLLRNEPNMPVRSVNGDAVRPLGAGGLGFDALAALEYTAVMGEQRTGIVRNAQGLNPDTLHDTMGGAMALMTNAQKRVRYIARTFAETGVKDLFLGVHAMLREGYGSADDSLEPPQYKAGKDWRTANPAAWSERDGIDVQVGVGSAGREHDLAVMNQILQMQERAVAHQGGLNGPLVTADNVYNALKRFAQAGNQKAPELFFSDPKEAKPQETKPDPALIQAQAEMQMKQADAAANLQLKAQENQAKLALEEQKAQQDFELQQQRIAGDLALKRETTAAELQMKREQLGAELELKREIAVMNAEVARETGHMRNDTVHVSDVEVGGDPG